MRCVGKQTVAEWKAVTDVLDALGDKVRISVLATFQPSHALKLARAFRKRYGKVLATMDNPTGEHRP